jgi:hypothetical protein
MRGETSRVPQLVLRVPLSENSFKDFSKLKKKSIVTEATENNKMPTVEK